MKVLNILVRRCLPLEALDDAVAFHERLIGQPARLRFDYPEYDLKSLAPFTATHATFMVDDISAFETHLPTVGASIVETAKSVPTGWNMLARHPDGTLVEYVQHRNPHPDDRLTGFPL